MDNMIILQTELDILKETRSVEYREIMNNINNFMMDTIFTECKAKIVRSWFRSGIDGYDICFEIGFHNTDENRIDFGSDLWLDYNSSTGRLSINHGTIGSFDRTNIYQFMRAKLLCEIYNHISQIEDSLEKFSKEIDITFKDLDKEIADKEHEIQLVLQDKRRKERDHILDQVHVGCFLRYKQGCQLHQDSKLFHITLKVKNITPVYFILTDGYTNRRIKKENIVAHIQQGHLEIV